MLHDVMEVTSDQLLELMNKAGFDNNFRPPQPLYDRTIEPAEDEWDHYDDSHVEYYPYDADVWGDLAEVCRSGTEQSPLDLFDYPVSGEHGLWQRHDLEVVQNYTAETWKVTNGHSLTWSVPADTETQYGLTFYQRDQDYGDGVNTFELLQFHCHTGSENFLDGKQYPGECHFVHVNDDGSGDLLVIGIWLDTDGVTEPNAAFQSLLDPVAVGLEADYPLEPSSISETIEVTGFTLDTLLGDYSKTEFWTWMGSLTTPPCSENVQWIMLHDVMEVTSDQLLELMNKAGFDNNFRPPQPLYDRTIEPAEDEWDHYDDSHVEYYPYDADVWGDLAEVCRSGTEQSPLDLFDYPVSGEHGSWQRHDLEVVQNYTAETWKVTNGHSLTWSVPADTETQYGLTFYQR